MVVDNLQLESVTQVLAAYQAAVYAKDVDAFVALYDRDVCVFDTWGRWSYGGAEAWREMVTDWFGSLGNEWVAVSFEDAKITPAQTVAVIHTFVTYQGLSAEGKALRAMTNRLTWALTQKAGVWKIIHEHSSAPADFETLKVSLQRS